MDREAWRAAGHGVTKSQTHRVTEQQLCLVSSLPHLRSDTNSQANFSFSKSDTQAQHMPRFQVIFLPSLFLAC